MIFRVLLVLAHMHVCVLNSVQFYHLRRFLYPPPQSRYRTFPQRFFVLPFYSHTLYCQTLSTYSFLRLKTSKSSLKLLFLSHPTCTCQKILFVPPSKYYISGMQLLLLTASNPTAIILVAANIHFSPGFPQKFLNCSPFCHSFHRLFFHVTLSIRLFLTTKWCFLFTERNYCDNCRFTCSCKK